MTAGTGPLPGRHRLPGLRGRRHRARQLPGRARPLGPRARARAAQGVPVQGRGAAPVAHAEAASPPTPPNYFTRLAEACFISQRRQASSPGNPAPTPCLPGPQPLPDERLRLEAQLVAGPCRHLARQHDSRSARDTAVRVAGLRQLRLPPTARPWFCLQDAASKPGIPTHRAGHSRDDFLRHKLTQDAQV